MEFQGVEISEEQLKPLLELVEKEWKFISRKPGGAQLDIKEFRNLLGFARSSFKTDAEFNVFSNHLRQHLLYDEKLISYWRSMVGRGRRRQSKTRRHRKSRKQTRRSRKH